MLASLLYHANKKKDAPDIALDKFMPDFDGGEDDDGKEEDERPTPARLKTKLMALTAALGGKVK